MKQRDGRNRKLARRMLSSKICSCLISNFSFFRLGPAAAYMPWKNIGFQQPMCQFVSKFVLETKFVPLFTKVSIVDKIETFHHGRRNSNFYCKTVHITNAETHKNTSCAILYC